MPFVRAVIALCALRRARRTDRRHADDPFYKGKRLTILINFAAGGPTDIEGRLFAKHLVKHIDGTPEHRGAEHGRRRRPGRREISRRGRRRRTAPWSGYFTGAAWIYAHRSASAIRVDFKSYEFVGYPARHHVHFVRTDVAPGMQGRRPTS